MIVPIYNVEKYLDRCVKSILSQTYYDIQVILVDDGSDDSSGTICDYYAILDERVLVIHKKNEGVSSARNTGLNVAIGEYIGFVDPDDYIDSDMFSSLYNRSLTTGADIVVCGFRSFGNSKKNFSLKLENKILTIDDGMRFLLNNEEMPAYLWNKIFRKNLFEEVSFPIHYRYEDVRVMHKLFLRANKIATVDSMPYYYQLRENSITGSTQLLNSKELIESYVERAKDLKNTNYYSLANVSLLILIRRIVMELYDNKDATNTYTRNLQVKANEIIEDAYQQLSVKQKVLNYFFVRSPKLYYMTIYKVGKIIKRLKR